MAGYGHVKRVGVLGAGSAGLQMARSLAARGFQPVVFEAANRPGGVWRQNYAGYGLQASTSRFPSR
jgi:dimethylaniline monooxygenase (N-oxide forming)